MNIRQLRKFIKNKRELDETYREIASKIGIIGINAAMVRYIENHEDYKPSRKIAKILNLDPDNGLTYTRTRRQALDEIARFNGYKSWCAFETFVLTRNMMYPIEEAERTKQ